jgi:hypothetical protein
MSHILSVLAVPLLLSGSYPLAMAWRANRESSLKHTLAWSFVAWGAWLLAFLAACVGQDHTPVAPFVALCMTCCAIVAVLGARRPQVGAWNFVVLGLLAVAMMPLAESMVKGGSLQLRWHQSALVGAIIVVGMLNYLPTRIGPAAVMVAVGCGVEILILVSPDEVAPNWRQVAPVSRCLLGFAPWAAYLSLRRPMPATPAFDRTWLDFRDRFGLIWSQRLREQFNRSASNASWPVYLYWQGLRRMPGTVQPSGPQQAAMTATLKALMKRFGSSEAPSDQEDVPV